MAKRKSFDEKSKGMHKSRKLIIDTVFGREDNTQRVFGYEKESEKKREVGERWTDSDGKEWEQKEGFKSFCSLSHCDNNFCQESFDLLVNLISFFMMILYCNVKEILYLITDEKKSCTVSKMSNVIIF